MKFIDFLTEKTAKKRKVIVVYGGGFQPFHQGHMSSYEEAKSAFPSADRYVASSSDVKVRPIPFKDKKFLAEQAGVTDLFVQVKSPLNPAEILSKYDPENDVLILVRSERDPVPYKKKDGSPGYYQPFVSLDKCKSFKANGYIFVTKKKVFSIGKEEVFSGSQIRSMYAKADDNKKKEIINALYPKATKPMKIKSLLDKYIGAVKEDVNFEFTELLIEGVHDQGIFKAVFLAGGPGSGKDYVLSNTLDGHGLTEINSDKALEFLMDKKGLDKRMPDSEKEAREHVRAKAKSMTELRQYLALKGRNGLIINGTGDDAEKVRKIKTRLEELGYETSMIMVNTSDEVSQARNIERGQRGGRTVPEKIRKEKWDNVQNARTELAKMFGTRYTEFDNSEDLRTAAPEVVKAKKDEMLQLFKNVRDFVTQKPKSEKAQGWIAQELQQKDTMPISKNVSMAHPDSKAAEKAREMGLQYYGFGRYGQNGKVTYRSIHDELVHVEKIDKMVEKHNKQTIKEDINSLFEAVTISITADTPEEAAEALHLLKSEPEDYEVEEQNQFSDSNAMRLLMLGNNVFAEEKKQKYITDKDGNPRVFMLRATAAKEAHTHNGEVVKLKKGYAVKLNEETKNVRLDQESLHSEVAMGKRGLIEESTRSTSSTSDYTINQDRGENYGHKETSTKSPKGTSQEAKGTKKEVNESIDKNIEPGLSMAASGENLGRGTLKVKQIKKPLEELTGDETGASIGDQKEDELKKKGIYLSTFKAKKFVG